MDRVSVIKEFFVKYNLYLSMYNLFRKKIMRVAKQAHRSIATDSDYADLCGLCDLSLYIDNI